jgi:hypothetical protein
MATKIDKKIVKYGVIKEDEKKISSPAAESDEGDEPSNVIHMHEKIERPDVLLGSTYKVKTPLSEHALYVTINDVVLNAGTPHELRRPFEVFINSKNMDHFQWIVALTRIISAVFRKGGDVTFLVEELKAVFDPRGGYFKKGGKYMPSLVAEIGDAIEYHLRTIGLIKNDGPDHGRLPDLPQLRRLQVRVTIICYRPETEKAAKPPFLSLTVNQIKALRTIHCEYNHTFLAAYNCASPYLELGSQV